MRYVVVVVVSFPKGRNESCQILRQVGLLHDRWRYHLTLPPHNLGKELEGRKVFSWLLAPMVSSTTTHKTFGPPDLMSTFSVSTRRVFGCVRHRTLVLRSGVRCSNHWATHDTCGMVMRNVKNT
ncbi:hypothetical protein TNCV_3661321 [Trichonephila clavipes]|nr:hypothetical protein TNCV_3661321 [Trichonephila clavipes]